MIQSVLRIEAGPPPLKPQTIQEGNPVGKLRPNLVVKKGPLPGEVDPDRFILLGFSRENTSPCLGPEIEAGGVDGQGYFVVELFGGFAFIYHTPHGIHRDIDPCRHAYLLSKRSRGIYHDGALNAFPFFCLDSLDLIGLCQNIYCFISDISGSHGPCLFHKTAQDPMGV